ncbi:MAG: hypothetical protein P8Q28_05020 [Luminiphilus sp.]|nr:hypothetical protein [Luminiphilus sp.]
MSVEEGCHAALEENLMAIAWLGQAFKVCGAQYGDADGAQYNG